MLTSILSRTKYVRELFYVPCNLDERIPLILPYAKRLNCEAK